MLLVNREMKENHPVVIDRLGHFAVGDLSSLSWAIRHTNQNPQKLEAPNLKLLRCLIVVRWE
jgi:hypothetical protein